MKKKGRKWRKWAVLLGGISLFLGAVPCRAAEGSVQIQLEELNSKKSDRENVLLELYQVGQVSEYGEPALDEKYGIGTYPQTAEDTEEAAALLEKQLTGDPVKSGRTDAEGMVRFDGLERGVYLVRAREAEHYGIMTPVLFHLPYYAEVDGQREGPFFTLEAKPKASWPGDPAEPVEPEKPQKPGDVETKDDRNMAAWLAAGLLSAGAAAVIYSRRKRRV